MFKLPIVLFITRMCKTKWLERDLAFEHFHLALTFIVEAMDTINGTHAEIGSFEKKCTESCDYKTKREATFTSFEFIISLTVFYRLLHPLDQ